MKYMLLMQSTAKDVTSVMNWPKEDLHAHIEFMGRLHTEFFKPGEVLDAQGLATPDQVRVIQASDDGEPIVTDGPFPESKEFLAGYWLLDVDEARALEAAAYISAAPGPGGKPLNFPILLHPIGEPPV